MIVMRGLLDLFLGSGYRLVANPLFDKVAGMVGALFEIQVAAITLPLFYGLELCRHGISTESADFFRLFG